MRQKAVESGRESHDLRYTYDASNRLTRVIDVGRRDWTYSYDANGNRTRSGQSFVGSTYYDYNAANQLCLRSTLGPNNCVAHGASADVVYSYDANGAQLNAPPTDANGAFTYDAKGFTASIRAGATTTGFAYADIDQTERTQAGASAFSNSALGLSATVAGASTTRYTRTDQGGLVSQRSGAGTHYYLFDGLGTVTGLTDASGAVVATYRYDPYGNNIATTGTVANPYRYAGGQLDTATGLTKFGARYYDPTTARWTQQDPSGQEANAYAYVGGNPVNRVDPSGRAWFDVPFPEWTDPSTWFDDFFADLVDDLSECEIALLLADGFIIAGTAAAPITAGASLGIDVAALAASFALSETVCD